MPASITCLHPDGDVVFPAGLEDVIGNGQEAGLGDAQARLLFGLANCAQLGGLAMFQVTTGNRPGPRTVYVLPLQQQQLPLIGDDHSYSDPRCA